MESKKKLISLYLVYRVYLDTSLADTSQLYDVARHL